MISAHIQLTDQFALPPPRLPGQPLPMTPVSPGQSAIACTLRQNINSALAIFGEIKFNLSLILGPAMA